MVIETKTVFHTPWFQIATLDSEAQAADTPYYCIMRPDGVIGLLLDELGRAVLIEQYRPPLGRSTLEMPAGAIEPGETPAQAMAREIVEETGFVCSSLILATTCRLMLNRESAVEHFFIGLRAQSKPDARVTENIQVHILERDRLLDLIISHRFEQTVALGAIYIVQKAYDIDLLSANVDVIEARFRSEL